jgi:hypothetical protein
MIALKLEAANISETSVNLYRLHGVTTQEIVIIKNLVS